MFNISSPGPPVKNRGTSKQRSTQCTLARNVSRNITVRQLTTFLTPYRTDLRYSSLQFERFKKL